MDKSYLCLKGHALVVQPQQQADTAVIYRYKDEKALHSSEDFQHSHFICICYIHSQKVGKQSSSI